MSAWMLFAAAAGALAGLVALAAERAFHLLRLPTRWAWAISLAASLALPLAVPRHADDPQAATPGTMRIAPAAAAAPASGSAGVRGDGRAAVIPALGPALRALEPTLRAVEPALPWAWGAATLLAMAGLAAGAVRLSIRRRRWEPAMVAGERVLLSDDVGPAVFGFTRPRIVLPRWALAWPEARLRMIVRHEREHVAARDPALLLLAGLVAAAVMPWSPAAWWQLRRLRLAVEMDCDARTLHGQADVAEYGRLLLDVGRRGRAGAAALAAFSEPRSFLERRIRAMTERIPRGRAPRLLGWAALGAAAAVCIAALPAPPLPLAPRAATLAAADTLPRLLDPAAVRRAMVMEYPPLLRDAGVTGEVVLRFHIDARGVPGEAEVVRASHPAFAEAARRVLRQTRWSSPGSRGATITVPFAFQLAAGAGRVATPLPAAPRDEPPGTRALADVDRQPELLDAQATRLLLQQGYPPLLRDAGVQGSVVVSMVVGADGLVHAPRVVSASHDAFREPALAAAAAMRFRPARKDGRAVPVRLSLPIEFRLANGDAAAR